MPGTYERVLIVAEQNGKKPLYLQDKFLILGMKKIARLNFLKMTPSKLAIFQKLKTS
jgi:hypothetical protein